MSKKSIFITSILSILIVVLYVISELNPSTYEYASSAYQVYLNGEILGLIEDENELYSLINNEQQEIKEKYSVDYVYPPDGLDIVEVNSFNDNYMPVDEIYKKIETADDFMIKGYIITIKPNEGDNIVINVLDKEVFNEAIHNFVLSFITEEELEEYIAGKRSISEIGSTISDMYFNEIITIKEGYISVKDKIYTDATMLAQYLLFGPDVNMDNYKVKEGDSIASISEEYKISPQEFLIANPSYSDETSLLVVGSNVNVTLIDPVITLTYEIYEISENVTPYKTKTIYDSTKEYGYSEVTKSGVDGLSLVHDTYQVVNGNASSEVTIIDSISIREMVEEEVTVGRRYSVSGSYVNISGSWGLPTNYPYMITSPFGWRSYKMHYGVDISGTGLGSPIYAVADGVVVEVGYRNTDGNYVILEHENNIYTQYAHLNRSIVSVGQSVSRGQKIGEMGQSGLASGVHLHFGVSIGLPYHGSYQFQNPLNYIKLK